MKNASQWALVSAALVLGIAYACATPEEIHGCQLGTNQTDCDVTLVQASEFETADASVQVGQAGSDSVSPSGGSSGSNSPPPAGGAAGTGSPPSGGGAGQGAAGNGQSAGAGGASGGTAGSGAGTGGVAGAGTAGTTGAAGTGGAGGSTAQSNFDPAACDFANRAGCEAKACATACPTNDGNYCSGNCQAIITCVAGDPTCVTAQDPMCGTPSTTPVFTPNTCTTQVNSSGSPTMAGTPASAALALMNCLCDSTRP